MRQPTFLAREGEEPKDVNDRCLGWQFSPFESSSHNRLPHLERWFSLS